MANGEIAWIKRIRKDSKLEGISVGEKVELVGISEDNQKQQGRVEYYDNIARFIIVLTRESPEEIRATTYYFEHERIEVGSQPMIVRKVCADYLEHDNNLREVGL